MYLDDFGYTWNEALTLVCDEAIFHRMKTYSNPEQTVLCMLGQWHSNKAMCSAVIATFSGYGLFGLAAELGVKFLDKLEQVADYRATFWVLELIWAAVGITIHCMQNRASMSVIPAQNNVCFKCGTTTTSGLDIWSCTSAWQILTCSCTVWWLLHHYFL